MTITLRPYQEAAIQSVYRYFETADGNPLIVLPTGTGKSLVIADFVKRALDQWPSTRILMVTHVKELIAQNFAELVKLWPEAPGGIYSAGLGKKQIGARILFAGIQSIYSKAMAVQQCDIILVDEAHLIPPKSETMYGRFLSELRAINPHLKVIGLTATPYRLGSGMLTDGDNPIFTDIAYEYPIDQAIEEGYLSEPITRATTLNLDVEGVKTSGGDFIQRDLQRAVDKEAITRAAIDEIVHHGQDREGWLVFASGVDHAKHIAEEIRSRGFSCETVFGETPAAERARIIQDFKDRKIRCLASMAVLTTGFNAPHVDLLAMLRPTKSTGLYVQMIGRGTRLAPGKDNCLVLDFAGNIHRHGPINQISVRGKRPGSGDAPVKTCDECAAIVFAGVRVCPACGTPFPEPEPKIAAHATVAPILARDTPQYMPCSGVRYRRHTKPGAPPSMRVEYKCGMTVHKEWVCFEHQGYAQKKARQWWASRLPGTTPPKTIDEAIERASRDIPAPDEIGLKRDGKFWRVEVCRWGGIAA